MIRILINIDEKTNQVGFEGRNDRGEQLSRMDAAYMISKIISALIRDGMAERGQKLLVPIASGFDSRVLSGRS